MLVTIDTATTWSIVHAERQRLIDDLDPLTTGQWETPSLCPAWSVHDVLAHLVDTARTGKVGFVRSMVRAKGDFDLANEHGIARCKFDDPRQTLAGLQESLTLTKIPPANRATRLVESIVHGEDIRRPLGLRGWYPVDGVREALSFQLKTAVSFGGGKERAEELRLVDTESGMSWGIGLETCGTALDLLLAVSGRPVDPHLLTGPGAERLTALEPDADARKQR